MGDEDVLSPFQMFHNVVGCQETQYKSPSHSEYPPTSKLFCEPTLWGRRGGGRIGVICDRICKRAQLAFKIILSFSAKLRLRSILGKTFLAAIQYLHTYLRVKF